jgi:uncharacterized protein (TIGR03437 family)
LYFDQGVAVDRSANIYIADTFNNRIRKVSNGTITTVVGTGTPGFSGDGGAATSAQLNQPLAVSVDSAGNLYIADTGNYRIRKVSGGTIATVAGIGISGFAGDRGLATDAQLSSPVGLAVDSAGSLYIADTAVSGPVSSSRIRKISSGVITTVAGGTAVFLDTADNVYVSFISVARSLNGQFVPVAGGGTDFSDGIPATSAAVGGSGVVDPAGNLYLKGVRRVSNGVIVTALPITNIGFDVPGGGGVLRGTTQLATDPAGNIYVVDASNHRVLELTPSSPPCSAQVTPGAFQPTASGGSVTATVQTSTSQCSWAVQSLPPWITYSGNAVSSGPGTVELSVAANAGATRSAVISIAGRLVPITQAGVPPAIYPGGVVNAASDLASVPLVPGSIASAFGNFLLAAPSRANSTPLPTSLAGLSMQFGSLSAPLFYADVGQVNFQVPWEVTGTQSSLAPVLNGQAGAAQVVNLAAFAPGIFTRNGQGTGQGAILDAAYNLIDGSNPATAGATVQIYCTGLGAVTNQPATGAPASSTLLSQTTASPTVTVGGAPASVVFSGLAPGFVGGYQVNVIVPENSSKGSAVPVVLAIGGASSNVVTMAVK